MGKKAKLYLSGLMLVLAMGLLPGLVSAQMDSEVLASKIAESLQSIRNPGYKTIAFSRIKNAGPRINIDELIDFANVKIVRGRRFKVIDRSKLSLILNEQKIHLSDFVSAQKYQELGKLLGVDLFIYGTMYRDALVLKAIDTQKSAIAWADVFPLNQNAREAEILMKIGGGVVNSMRADLKRLKKEKINQISFWDIKPTGSFPPEAVMDYLSVAITKDGNFQVVDRENLKLITKEQKLNQSMFINQENAKRLGEIYGVDAFIYGSLTQRPDGTIIASLKMLNIFNGVIEWADLIKVNQQNAGGTAGNGQGAKGKAPKGMAYIPPGEFIMGTNKSPKISRPQRRVKSKGFYIDTTEVSNSEYAKFVTKRKYRAPVGWKGKKPPPGGENLPVVGITWEDARRYCRFAGKRLPSEIEWEKASRGASGQKFPWGDDTFSPAFTVTREGGYKGPVSVMEPTKDISPYGLKFMAGNVREWVKDFFSPYTGKRKRKSQRERVIRGGSWATNSHSSPTYFRSSSNPNLAWQDVGTRCAKTKK